MLDPGCQTFGTWCPSSVSSLILSLSQLCSQGSLLHGGLWQAQPRDSSFSSTPRPAGSCTPVPDASSWPGAGRIHCGAREHRSCPRRQSKPAEVYHAGRERDGLSIREREVWAVSRNRRADLSWRRGRIRALEGPPGLRDGEEQRGSLQSPQRPSQRPLRGSRGSQRLWLKGVSRGLWLLRIPCPWWSHKSVLMGEGR